MAGEKLQLLGAVGQEVVKFLELLEQSSYSKMSKPSVAFLGYASQRLARFIPSEH